MVGDCVSSDHRAGQGTVAFLPNPSTDDGAIRFGGKGGAALEGEGAGIFLRQKSPDSRRLVVRRMVGAQLDECV